uniref:AAA+ ATPase domain-containing protein n=1 Tax=Glossina pallidipes TaxID=7398 RepID=A0A1A9Z6E6_GLOPL
MDIDEEEIFNTLMNSYKEDSKNFENETIRSLDFKSITKFQCFLIGTMIIAALLGVFVSHYHCISANGESALEMMEGLFSNYRKQYTDFIASKPDYCDSRALLDSRKILKNIRKQNILHQGKALHQLEIALNTENDLNAIAFVGPTGVGKSLILSHLIANFPWPENVHIYAWNTQVKDESEKFHMLRVLIERLSECGCNLLIIENLQPSDHGLVYLVNNLIAEIVNGQKRIIIVYVFNLNWMGDEYLLKEQREFLTKSLPVAHVINFKSFTKHEIPDCIYREMSFEKVTLPPNDIDDIVGTVDVPRTGCKDINSKVLLYGTIKNK